MFVTGSQTRRNTELRNTELLHLAVARLCRAGRALAAAAC